MNDLQRSSVNDLFRSFLALTIAVAAFIAPVIISNIPSNSSHHPYNSFIFWLSQLGPANGIIPRAQRMFRRAYLQIIPEIILKSSSAHPKTIRQLAFPSPGHPKKREQEPTEGGANSCHASSCTDISIFSTCRAASIIKKQDTVFNMVRRLLWIFLWVDNHISFNTQKYR